MLSVYWQLIVALMIIRRQRARGYAEVYLGTYRRFREMYPKTAELLRDRGYTLLGKTVLPDNDKPAYWKDSEHGYCCSVCNNCVSKRQYNYCPYCGSLMQKVD